MNKKIDISKGMTAWLWFALVLSIFTTITNGMYGRWLSVFIAIGAMAGLCILLFGKKRCGFTLLCLCYVLAFAEGVYQGIAGNTGVLTSIFMSLIGSVFIPGITYLFLRKTK